MLRELMTTLLDLLGLLCLAAGAGFALGYIIGPAGIVGAGVVLIAGSTLITWLGTPRKAKQ